MVTLRAVALVLNGLLVLMGFWGLSRFRLVDLSDILIVATILIAPVVNSTTIILQARNPN